MRVILTIYFNDKSIPNLFIDDSANILKKNTTVEYNGHEFFVLISGKDKIKIEESNLSPELQGITIERINSCVKGVFLRLSKKNDQFSLEILHEQYVVKAMPFMVGSLVSSPLIGAITGICIAGGPAGWCLGAIIAGGVGITMSLGTMVTTVAVDHYAPSTAPKFSK